jgi:hypothetical protein
MEMLEMLEMLTQRIQILRRIRSSRGTVGRAIKLPKKMTPRRKLRAKIAKLKLKT